MKIKISDEFWARVEPLIPTHLNMSNELGSIRSKPGRKPLDDEIAGNLKTFDFCKKNPQLLPIAVCQPGYGNAENIEKLLNKHKFYALKFHPYYLGINANHDLYNPYLNLAEKYKLPCVFHTANGTSDSKLVYDLAKKYPNAEVFSGPDKTSTTDKKKVSPRQP